MTAAATRVGEMLGKCLLLSLPLLVLVASYLVLDPFRVLYHYPDFASNIIAIPNRDYVSTQMYLNTYQARRYQSFILGSSRTMAFRTRDWRPYLVDTAAFHFDASNESLYGVWKKLEFLEQHSPGLKNVLIVADPPLLRETQDLPEHIFRKDPRLTGEWPLSFQWTFFKVYLADYFYLKYFRRRFLGEFSIDMAAVLFKNSMYYDPVTNDLSVPDIEQQIQHDSLGFYAQPRRFPTRSGKPAVAPAVIAGPQLRQLVAVRNILRRNHTRYQLVISPLYQQQQLNPADLAILQRLFGATRVHDFSGINPLTQSVGNYYDEYHYRPAVGRQILKAIYAPALPSDKH